MVLLLPNLARMVVGICFKISGEGGYLLSDEDYKEAVRSELAERNLRFRQDEIIELEYLGKSVDKHLVEFIIEDKILLDMKGRKFLRHPLFYKQFLSYLQKENIPLAFVVDFHSRRLQIRRVLNPNYNYQL